MSFFLSYVVFFSPFCLKVGHVVFFGLVSVLGEVSFSTGDVVVWEVRSGLGSVAVSWGSVGPCRLLAVGEAWSVSCARFGIPGTWASLGGLSEPGPSMLQKKTKSS